TAEPDPALAEEQAAVSAPTPQPLLYLHGGTDGCVGAEVVAAISDAVIVEGAGHFLHLEKPDEINERIVAFLS
ncbi:MAG: alpha/beta fold hydrolase, partial [Actinomycetota bacterium]